MSRPSRSSRPDSADSDEEFCRQAFISATAGPDSRGQLRTMEEFVQLLQRTGRNPDHTALRRLWKAANRSGTGVDLDSFLEVCSQEQVTSRDELLEAFHAIDQNGDGFLSLDEFVAMLSEGGDPVPRREARELLQRHDRNKDGRLDYEEFIDFVLGDIERSRKSLGKSPKPRQRRRSREAEEKEWEEEQQEEVEERKMHPAPRRKRAGSSGSGGGSSQLLRLGSEQPPRAKPLRIPGDLQRWEKKELLGFYVLDEADGMRLVRSTSYSLSLRKSSSLFITMSPKSQDAFKTMSSECDLGFALVKDGRIVTVAEARVGNATSDVIGVKGDFDSGEYQLLPFCNGGKLTLQTDSGKHKATIKKDRSGNHALTTAVKDAIEDIFSLCDINQDGQLDRKEFEFYNSIASDEPMSDELWSALQNLVQLKDNDKVDVDAFIDLCKQEAEADEWSDENLWINLRSFGTNPNLIISGAFAFSLAIHCSDSRGFTVDYVDPFKFPQKLLLRSLATLVKEKGSYVKCQECTLYCLETPTKIYLAGEKDGAAVPTTLLLDFSGSYGVQGSDQKQTLYVRKTNSLLLMLEPESPTYKFAAVVSVE